MIEKIFVVLFLPINALEIAAFLFGCLFIVINLVFLRGLTRVVCLIGTFCFMFFITIMAHAALQPGSNETFNAVQVEPSHNTILYSFDSMQACQSYADSYAKNTDVNVSCEVVK